MFIKIMKKIPKYKNLRKKSDFVTKLRYYRLGIVKVLKL